MPGWSETKDFLRRTFKIVMDEPEWVGLGWSFETPDGGTTIQKQRVELVTALDEPHALVWSDVIEVDRVPPRIALEHNMSLATGGIAITGQLYVLRAIVRLEGLDFGYLEKTMRYVAHEAARLRITTPAPP